MSQQVLVFNSGSSSFKFSLFEASSHALLLSGLAERLGQPDAQITFKHSGNKTTKAIPSADHKAAIQTLVDAFPGYELSFDDVSVVGHRIVSGGEYFAESILIDAENLKLIDKCSELAPLHNPAAVTGIQAVLTLFPDMPNVGVFDSAFHQTMPAKAYLYPIPYELYSEHSIRRYGAHGTSHRYVSEKAIETLGLNTDDCQMITAHLGNGCSASAVVNGKCVDTTMGLTPLEGLMMGTRSGDVDPSLHLFLQQKFGWSLEKITNMLNRESGLLGISGLSNDMRTLEDAEKEGNEKAALAIEMFCFRLARQIAGLAASLNRIDALVFTGGIGENSDVIRERVLKNLSVLGFSIDTDKNSENGKSTNGVITTSDSTRAVVVQTDEEWMIAQDSLKLTQQ